MTPREWAEALAPLEGVSLAEVDATAELQTRRDRKYVVTDDVAWRLLARLGPQVRVLDVDGVRARRYETLYFDTATLRAYLDAAHGRPRRSKVRIRTYVDSDLCVVEVKARDQRGRTVKHRWPHDPARRHELTPEARAFVERVDPQPDRDPLLATLTTRYHRTTLLVDAAGSRVTIDIGVSGERADGRVVRLPGVALIETKSPNHPGPIDRALWGDGHRPVKISKYCVAMALLHPSLPANRWHRLLEGRLASAVSS